MTLYDTKKLKKKRKAKSNSTRIFDKTWERLRNINIDFCMEKIFCYFATLSLSFDRIQLWFRVFHPPSIPAICAKWRKKKTTKWSLMRVEQLSPSTRNPVLYDILISRFPPFIVLFVFFKNNQQFLQDYKNLHFHCIHQKKTSATLKQKNLGNFCELHTRDNWFDWNETKIWGNIEKWERAKVRSVDKTANWLNQSHIILLTKQT